MDDVVVRALIIVVSIIVFILLFKSYGKNWTKEKQKDEIPTNTAYQEKVSYKKVTLLSYHLPTILNFIGWIYFLLSLIGGIIIWVNSEKRGYSYFSSDTDNVMKGLGIASTFSSLVVLLICLGIARVIEQNIFIIKNISK